MTTELMVVVMAYCVDVAYCLPNYKAFVYGGALYIS